MIKKYIPFLRASISNIFIYRARIFLWTFVEIFRFVMLLFLWISVYKTNVSINGFTLQEMVVYFLIMSITGIFSQSDVQYMMADEIRKGTLSYYLIKPINYKRRLLFENLGGVIGNTLIIAPLAIITLVIVFLIFNISLPVNAIQIVSFIAYLPLIVLFVFEFGFLFGNLMIYTENNFGLAILMAVIVGALSGRLIPIAFYPDWLRNVVELLPFRFISYPPLIILGKINNLDILLGIVTLIGWIIVFRMINFIVFKLSMKRMVVFGG